ncbi:dual specificity testis-specific protein kinase 2-like [Pollicipes pollicipes]|uniref:dual specificity testis-specific protein kinase 2-like n=1 Tax=Pollicipes pollicipes TaxID=41117 RepID=UPI001885783D|nr:dual specificity testis-specific protein kinase 2-like [Pollicipes pollicipes]
MGACVHEGQLHALTEYINGGSLEQLVQSEEPLSWETRASLGLDIARALHYLHRRQVFHRDLTSKNVLIRRNDDGSLSGVVGDFGLAAKIPNPLLPSPLSTVGSFWWMAPECITNRPYNQRADVFSFGVILLEMMARVSADPDVLQRTPSFGIDYLAFVSLCPADCQLELLLIAFSCCVHEAASRPSFGELVRRLEAVLSGLRAELRRAVSPTPRLAHAEERHQRTCRRTSRPRCPAVDHRRSLSDDNQLALADACSPSDKARVHRRHSHCRETRPRPALRSPRDVAEYMAARDPAYKPGDTANPFNALKQYRDGRNVGEPEPAELSPGSCRSEQSQEELARWRAPLAHRSSSVYTDSSDDISSLGCEAEERGRPDRGGGDTDIRQIVEYFERSGGGRACVYSTARYLLFGP